MTPTRPGRTQYTQISRDQGGQERSQEAQHRILLREYLRVSKDPDGRERSPDQQHDDHIRDGKREHFDLHPEPYRDTGSASRHSAKARADFDRMMTDLEKGEFGADGLAVWEPSRGSRQVWEWARLIDLLAKARLVVWVHTGSEGGRFYDLNHPRDRKDLQDDAVDAEYESGKTSLRVARDHAARAREGAPAGRLAVGQIAEYHPRTGRLIRRTWDPETSKLPLELFTRFGAGEVLMTIERDWARRGIVNGKGKPYSHQQLRHMLRNRSYIGERVHIIGQPGKRWWQVAPGDATITTGQWEPLLKNADGSADVALFDAVQAILTTEGRAVTRPGGARHLLSMIGRCDPCGAVLSAKLRRGEGIYQCKARSCVTVPEDELDGFVRLALQAFLADPEQYRQLDHGEHTAGELREARATRDRVQGHYDELKAEARLYRITPAEFAEMAPPVRADLEEAKAAVRRLETPPRLAGLITPGPDVAERWPVDVVVERKIAAALLQRDAVGELRIVRSSRPGRFRVPIEERTAFDKEE